MTSLPELRAELKAWHALGMECINRGFESTHDHGLGKERGRWVWLPSGNIGEVCKTCGKVIAPLNKGLEQTE